MKKGFDRLRGAATAGAMGLGLLGAGIGTGRAATFTISSSSAFVLRSGSNPFTAGVTPFVGVVWNRIGATTISGHRGLTTATSLASSISRGTFTTLLGVGSFVVSSGKSAFGISDATLASVSNPSATVTSSRFSGATDAFDNALWMAVNQTLFVNPDNKVDLTGNTLTSDTYAIIPGIINATIEYYFAPNRNVVRAMYTLTNTTGTDQAIEVRIGGNLGSDGTTTVQATSDADLIIEDTDLWHVTNDNRTPGADGQFDPGITLTRCGTGAPVCPQNGVVLGWADVNVDDFLYFYSVTVPANSSRRVMNFAELGRLSSGLATRATDFETLEAANTAGLLTGLTTAECEEIVNYDVTGTACAALTPTSPPVASSSSGSFSLPGLAALMSLVGLFRLGRKKD